MRHSWFTLAISLILALGSTRVMRAENNASSAWRWEVDEGRSLELHGPKGLLWRLNYAKELAKFYFDPLRTADGVDMTWVAPYDHPWHYGLWFSWKFINGINYWEIAPNNDGHPRGRSMIGSVEILETSPQGATVRIHQALHPDRDAEAVATETVLLHIETPRPDGAYAIDWRHSTTALVDLELSGTAGYGGLAFRAGQDWREPEFRTAQGVGRVGELRDEHHPWVTCSGNSHTNPVGLTLFDHPANPRHPTRWFLSAIMFDKEQARDKFNHSQEFPFYFFNPCIFSEQPYSIPKGEVLVLYYRALIHPGRGDVRRLETEFERFSRLDPMESASPHPAE